MPLLVSARLETLVVLVLVAGGAVQVTACDLSRAVERYWNDLRAGDLVETRTRVESSGHRSWTVCLAEVISRKDRLVLEVSERFEGEADAGPAGGPGRKVALASGSTFVMTGAAGQPRKLIETRWTLDGPRRTKPREEALEPAQAANRLPGLAAYCAGEPALTTEPVETAAGTFRCRLYQVDGSRMWISAEVPLGGLVKVIASGPGETLESKVTRVRKGTR